MQIRSRICARKFKSDDRPAIISIAGNNKETFSIMHIDVSRAYFHAKAQRPVLMRLPVEERMGTDAGEIGLTKKSMYVTRDAASNWERDWQEPSKNWVVQLGLSSKNLFHHKEDRVSGLTHGGVVKSVKTLNKLAEARNRVSTRSQTR